MSKRNEYPPDLGQVPDRVIAEREGVRFETVCRWRKKLGIPRARSAWPVGSNHVQTFVADDVIEAIEASGDGTRASKVRKLIVSALDARGLLDAG